VFNFRYSYTDIHKKITLKVVNINFEVFRFQSSSGSNIVQSCEQENSATADLQSEHILTEIDHPEPDIVLGCL